MVTQNRQIIIANTGPLIFIAWMILFTQWFCDLALLFILSIRPEGYAVRQHEFLLTLPGPILATIMLLIISLTIQKKNRKYGVSISIMIIFTLFEYWVSSVAYANIC
jgi:hypothetical protein